ncbi:MAG: M48 family metalloprotease [Gaiellales bacterium]
MAWLLVAGLTTMFAALGWLVSDRRGATTFGFCALLAALAAYAFCDRAIMGSLGARRMTLAENPVLASTVERLSTRLALTPPRLALINDGFPRAFVVGRGPGSATLVISTALVGAVSSDELDAVLAHELAHVKRRDVLVQSFAVLLGSSVLELARLGGWFRRGLVAVLAPIGAAFTHLLLSPRRELDADVLAAAVTDPLDLASALEKLEAAGDLVSFSGSPATEPLYTVSPFDESDRITRQFSTHPPTADRVARLRREAAN